MFDEDVKKEDFLAEQKKLQSFLAAADAKNMDGPWQVLHLYRNTNCFDANHCPTFKNISAENL